MHVSVRVEWAVQPAMPHAAGGVSRPVAGTSKAVHGATIVASVAVHAMLGGGLFWLALRTLGSAPDLHSGTGFPSAPPIEDPIAVELPVVGDEVALEERPVDPVGDPPVVAGGATIARLDTGGGGRGGDDHVLAPALNLADADERMRLSPDLLSRLDRDQLQRLRVARVRQSWENRRATTHPTELTLLVTGSGSRLERRAPSPLEPSRGALQSPSPSVRGGEIGAGGTQPEQERRSPTLEDAERRSGGAEVGSLRGAPGTGVFDGRAGLDHRVSAPIASARPDVTRAPVAVPANESARPRDDVDSSQEVATTVRSLVHASTAGGAPGEGVGGSAGGGEPAAGGGAGPGSHGSPMGVGAGETFDYWTSDPRLLPYFRQLHARIDPLWANAFPKSALLELKQGTVILVFTVSADGRVHVQWPPVRPSGIDEFDRNCADAIRRAAPLPPIPRELGVGSLTIRAPFVQSNPIVK
jgi:TonB family protein